MLKHIYIIKVTVCVFFIGGDTVGPTVLKFGIEVRIYPWEVIGYISLRYHQPLGSGALKEGFQGLYSPNHAFVHFAGGLEFAEGLENAPASFL